MAELAGRFPDIDATARESATMLLDGLADDSVLCLDGLALPAFEMLPAHCDRLKIVTLVHHPLALETGLSAAEAARFHAIEQHLLPACRGVLCPSPASAAGVEAYGVLAARVRIVPPGLDHPARRERASHAGPLRLLSVGTVTPRKGHVLLVQALGRLAELDWRLTILGSLERDPPTVAALRAAIAESGLGTRIELLGEWPPERLSEAYAAADLFVLASYHEGYGMVLAEAMAHGLPILSTTAGAIPDTVPPAAGLLVPPGDADALASALARLIADAGLRARFVAGAYEAASALPGWDRTGDLFAAALDALAQDDFRSNRPEI